MVEGQGRSWSFLAVFFGDQGQKIGEAEEVEEGNVRPRVLLPRFALREPSHERLNLSTLCVS